MALLHLNQDSFVTEVIGSSKPCVVDFWASWCGPCKMIAPMIDNIAEELEGEAVIGKVNVDEENALSMEYSVMSIPTLIFFKDGKEVDRMVGVTSKDVIVEKINSLK